MKQIILFLSIIFTFLEASNSLINEESPYLKQHAQNPVDWHAWNTQSLNLAKDENKLIFVSIGYSTCHWCHVMRDESFDDKSIAKALNKDYISIKIDREELPYIDSFYQEVFRKLKDTKNGWPLNFILSPDKELIYISTYIPKSFKYDIEGMDTLIPRLTKEFNHNQLDNIIAANKNLLNKKVVKNISLTSSLDLVYIKSMEKRFDTKFKGFDSQTKFPLAMHLNLLYELSLLKDNPLKNKAFTMFKESLESMGLGGVFDQVGGGFYRYSVNKDWSLPHFEKMLYTQAELLPLYYRLYTKTKNPKYKNIILKTIDFLNKNLKTKKGLYFSAMDADSINDIGNKEEGFYYTHKYDEVNELLIKNKIANSEEILEYLGFDDFGNLNNDRNNIFIRQELNKPKNLAKALEILKKMREKKLKPFIDKKVITSWNALMIKGIFDISFLDEKYKYDALNSLDALLEELYIDGVLYHQKIGNNKVNQEALLEDYSFVIDLLLHAYELTYKKEYLLLSNELIDISFDQFFKEGIWYSDNKKEYKASFNDKYYVSALSRMFHNLLSYSNLVYDLEMLEKTKKIIESYRQDILNNMDNSPEAIRAIVRKDIGDIILKSNNTNMLKSLGQIEEINYPFILRNIEQTFQYLACDEKSCFAYDRSLNKLIQQIEK